MTKENLKNLLKGCYKEKSEMPGLIVRGIRKPSYEIMYQLEKEHGIPFGVWKNIVNWLEKEVETPTTKASTK